MSVRGRSRGAPAGPRFDASRFAEGLRRSNQDLLRHWVSYGTVATWDGPDGKPNYADPRAVVVTPAGVEVDVVLEPSGYPVTCRHGWGGRGSVVTPIRPGDQVVVGIPDGDVSMVPQILAIVSGSSDPLPVEEDGLPVFRNDRVSVFARGVPVEVRTDGGGKVTVGADGTVVAASPGTSVTVDKAGTIALGTDATDALVMGTTYRTAQAAMNGTMATAAAAGQAAAAALAAAAAVTPLDPLQPGFDALAAAFTALQEAIQAFEAQSATYLSAVSKTL